MEAVEVLVSKLTVEEKSALLEGVNSWNTNAVPRLGIPALCMTDGPHGVRKVREAAGGFGVSDNETSSAFPTSATVAGSWDPGLVFRMGRAIAEECVDLGVHLLLAPGVNIKRSPLCGRNFEYFSEDPLLSGVFGAAFVEGVQSKGVGCTVKHFAANSNETYRFIGDSVVDERALREIYLRAFERIVKQSAPAAIMCSYNRVNSIFASQNRTLLTDILRGEWGFGGAVVTDWGATVDRVEGLKAGCDLDMPGSVLHNRKSVIGAIRRGELSPEVADRSVARILKLVDRYSTPPLAAGQNSGGPEREDHKSLAREIAVQSAVLLKNDGVLPLDRTRPVLVVGEMFEKMRYQGAGSSLINPSHLVSAKNAFDARDIDYRYAKGFRCFYTGRDEALERDALAAAETAETVVFFGGLSDFEESEGFDREHLRLGENQTVLLEALIATGKKVVLVLHAGAPVEVPFFDGLAALLDMYLPGMEGGEAAAALLFGDIAPSGKLTESWPLRIQDSSCFADYGRSPVARYYESIYVGYRFYDKAQTRLRFPFGYGLSYTSFGYSDPKVEVLGSRITVSAAITNTGMRDGAEAVQVYAKNAKSAVFKAEKELRAFSKIFLKAGESGKVVMHFEKSDLCYWNVKRRSWVLENGNYEILVAASAADIRLSLPLTISDGEDSPSPNDAKTEAAWHMPPREVPREFPDLLGYPLPLPDNAVTLDSPLSALRNSFIGKLLYAAVMGVVAREYKRALKMSDSPERDTRLKNTYFILRMIPFNSIRSLCMASGGRVSWNTALAFVEFANGRPFRGLRQMLRRDKP